MLDAHRQVEPVKHMESWTNACRLSQRPRPAGAIAEDGRLRARCCAKAMQHAAQLLGLPIGLGWHTAEDDLLAIIIAGLRDEHLEGPYLIAAHRAHVTGVDGQRDRLRVCRRRRRRWRHDRRALQSGADLQGPTLDGVDCREITEREEGLQQGASAAVGQQGTELGQHALILWGAVIGHDLRHRREDRAQGHTALAGLKPRSAELNQPSPRATPPRPTSIGTAGRLHSEWVADIRPESPADFVGMRNLSPAERAVVYE